MSLVYNNKKLIGKCSKFKIEIVQGTSPSVMLENFELKQPQLNENQQIVFDGLKFIFVNYNREFGNDGNIKYALRDLYWYLGTDHSILENKKLVSMCESYYRLSDDEFAQVLEVLLRRAQEQEEE